MVDDCHTIKAAILDFDGFFYKRSNSQKFHIAVKAGEDVQYDASHLPPCPETAAAISDLHNIGVKMVILTHARKEWVRDGLAVLSQKTGQPLSDIFPDDLILDLSDTNFTHKHESAEPFLKALDCLNDVHGTNIHPTQCLVGEDTKINLFHPHQIGMQTLFVTHENLVKTSPDDRAYIDEIHTNLSMTAAILKMRHRQTLNDALGGPEL